MDYKKLYEEALERAKEILSGKGEWNMTDMFEVKPVIEALFPQLRESEDDEQYQEVLRRFKEARK